MTSMRYSNFEWQIVRDGAVVFHSVSKKLVIHEYRALTGIRLSDADFARAFANRTREVK